METILSLITRLLMGYIFLIAVRGKRAYTATTDYMQVMGISSSLLALTIFVEFRGGLALFFGFQMRLAALDLGFFSLPTALIFHLAVDPNQAIHFMKNFVVAGNCLC